MEGKRPKSPTIAGILSGLMPGLGQFYCRQWGKGAGFLIGALAVDAAFGVSSQLLAVLEAFGSGVPPGPSGMFLVGSLLFLAIAIWSIADAVRFAKRTHNQ